MLGGSAQLLARACGVKQEELTIITVGGQAVHRIHILHAVYLLGRFAQFLARACDFKQEELARITVG